MLQSHGLSPRDILRCVTGASVQVGKEIAQRLFVWRPFVDLEDAIEREIRLCHILSYLVISTASCDLIRQQTTLLKAPC